MTEPIVHELLWCRYCGVGWGTLDAVIPETCPRCDRRDWIRTGDDRPAGATEDEDEEQS